MRIGQYSLAAILNDLAGLIDAGPMDSHEELLRSSPYSSTAAGTIDNTGISSRFAEKNDAAALRAPRVKEVEMNKEIEKDDAQQLADVHAVLIQQFLAAGFLPDMKLIASSMRISPDKLTKRLNDLANLHGLVLHPHAAEPWVVHPFATTPTLHYVEGKQHGWWAPCIWCALGIAQLAGGEARIHTRLGAETEPTVLEVKDGVPLQADRIFVHFSIPPRDAWNNVHQHCSLVLPFRSQSAVGQWCEKYGQSYGEVVTLQATAALARRWYGPYAQPSWRKWTVEQAQQIFRDSGLTSAFWELSGRGTY